MRRSVVVLAVAAVAALALWLVGGTDVEPLQPRGAEGAVGRAESASQRAGVVADPARVTDADHRERIDAPPDARLSDPAIRAALAGFRGRVVLHDRTPVPGVRVRIYRADVGSFLRPGVGYTSGPMPAPDITPLETVTADDGRFELRGAWPGVAHLLRVDAVDREAASDAVRRGDGTFRIVQTTPAPGEVVELGDVVLERGAVLLGRVVDGRGLPVAGATVRAVQAPAYLFQVAPLERVGPTSGVLMRERDACTVMMAPPWLAEVWDALPIVSTATAADGTFALVGVDAGVNAVAVTAVDRPPWSKAGLEIAVGERRNLGDITLRDGVDARIRVVDADDEPVAGIEVVVGVPGFALHPGFDLLTARGATDADGRFHAGGFELGKELTVAVRRPGTLAWIDDGRRALVDRERTVRLGATHDLTVRTLGSDGAPIADPRLRLIPGRLRSSAVDLSMVGLLDSVSLAGRGVKLPDGAVRIEDLAPGRYTLLARAPGHAVAARSFTLAGDHEEVIELAAARTMTVLVLDPDGAPLQNAAVFVLPRGGPAERLSHVPLNCGLTGPEGRLSVDEVAAPRGVFTARHPAFGAVHADTPIPAPAPELVLRLAAPGSVRGILLEGGLAPEPGKWMLVLEPRDAGRVRAFAAVPPMRTPDLEGRFHFASVQPGSYRVVAHHSLREITGIGSAMSFFQGKRELFPFLHRDIDVVSEAEVKVELDAYNAARLEGPGANIRGTVTLDGLPAKDAIVTAETEQGPFRAGKVGTDGRFDLGHVLAGDVQLQVLPAAIGKTRKRSLALNRYWNERTRVVAGEPQVFDIEIVTTTFAGSILDPAGLPVAGADVILLPDADTSATLMTRSDAKGRYAFAEVPRGSYLVLARQRRVGHGVVPRVVVRGAVAVDVQLTAYVEVRGRIDPELFPGDRRGVGVQLVPVGGATAAAPPARGGVRADGSFVIEDVLPASYTAVVTAAGERVDHDGAVVVGPGGLTGLEIRPR